MSSPAEKPLPTSEAFDEKQFYLDEFRGRTLLFSIPIEELQRDDDQARLAAMVRDLLTNDTRVVTLVSTVDATRGDQVLRRLQRRLGPLIFREETIPLFPQRGARAGAFVQLQADAFAASETATALLTTVWTILRRGPLFVGVMAGASRAAATRFAQEVATRLRVHKLIRVEPEGGVTGADGRTPAAIEGTAARVSLTRRCRKQHDRRDRRRIPAEPWPGVTRPWIVRIRRNDSSRSARTVQELAVHEQTTSTVASTARSARYGRRNPASRSVYPVSVLTSSISESYSNDGPRDMSWERSAMKQLFNRGLASALSREIINIVQIATRSTMAFCLIVEGESAERAATGWLSIDGSIEPTCDRHIALLLPEMLRDGTQVSDIELVDGYNQLLVTSFDVQSARVCTGMARRRDAPSFDLIDSCRLHGLVPVASQLAALHARCLEHTRR